MTQRRRKRQAAFRREIVLLGAALTFTCGGLEASAQSAKAKKLPTTFKSGRYLVGKQIGAGIYRSTGGRSCYWAKNTKSGEIINNELVDGPSVLVVDGSEFTITIKCPAPFVVTSAGTPSILAKTSRGLSTGTYLVGSQIGAGTYVSVGGKSCYWSSNTKGGDIIANELIHGQSVMVVAGTEFSVTIKCPSPFMSISDAGLRPLTGSIGSGTYLVGTQVSAATYMSPGGKSCYWSTNTKTGDIIDNELIDGPSVLVIDGSEFSVTIKCPSPFTKS